MLKYAHFEPFDTKWPISELFTPNDPKGNKWEQCAHFGTMPLTSMKDHPYIWPWFHILNLCMMAKMKIRPYWRRHWSIHVQGHVRLHYHKL
jgi:hypothetical protein